MKRTPAEEEEARPPRKKIVPPPPLPSSKAAKKSQEQTEIQEEPAIPSEEPKIPDEFLAEIPDADLESESVEAISPKHKPTISAAKNIVILSPEYLKNTEYKVLEKVTVRDVSQTGFNKKEAREALQFEAYRRFGSQAKGIVNITYGGKAGFISDSARFSEVGGEVITWQGEAPPPKEEKEVIEKEKETKTEPEPAKEPEPTAPAPSPQTETKPEPAPPAPDIKEPAPSPQTEPQAETKPPVPDAQTRPEPPPPPAPTITEQPLAD